MHEPDPAQSKKATGKIRLTTPGTAEYVSRIRRAVTDLARTVGFSEDDTSKIEMAIGEACDNIVKHAYAPNREWHSKRDPEIRLTIHVENGRLVIEINDHGQGFDFANYRPPTSHQSVAAGKTSGYGIFIMREFMDEVQYSSSSKIGNTLRLVKYLKKT